MPTVHYTSRRFLRRQGVRVPRRLPRVPRLVRLVRSSSSSSPASKRLFECNDDCNDSAREEDEQLIMHSPLQADYFAAYTADAKNGSQLFDGSGIDADRHYNDNGNVIQDHDDGYENMHTWGASTSPINALDGSPKKISALYGNDATELDLGEMESIGSHMHIAEKVKKRKATSDEDTLDTTSSNESNSSGLVSMHGLVSVHERSAKQRRICTDNENQTVVLARSNSPLEQEEYDVNEKIYSWDRGTLYEANVLKKKCQEEHDGDMAATEGWKYLVHYFGYKKSHDRWLTSSDMMKMTAANHEYYCKLRVTSVEEKDGDEDQITADISSPGHQEYHVGEKVYACRDRGNLYEAKVLRKKSEGENDDGTWKYLVNFFGYKKSHDRWLTSSSLMKMDAANQLYYCKVRGIPVEEKDGDVCVRSENTPSNKSCEGTRVSPTNVIHVPGESDACHFVKFDGSPLSVDVRRGMTLLDVRHNIPSNCDYFFRVDGSIISKKMENAYLVDAITEENILVALVSKLALEMGDNTPAETDRPLSFNVVDLQQSKLAMEKNDNQVMSEEENVHVNSEDPERISARDSTTLGLVRARKGGKVWKKSSKTKSSIVGVYATSNGKWKIEVGYHGKKCCMTSFSTERDAAIANKVVRDILQTTKRSALSAQQVLSNMQLAKDKALEALAQRKTAGQEKVEQTSEAQKLGCPTNIDSKSANTSEPASSGNDIMEHDTPGMTNKRKQNMVLDSLAHRRQLLAIVKEGRLVAEDRAKELLCCNGDNQKLNLLAVDIDGKPLSIEIRSGMTLLDLRQDVLSNGDFLFQVNESIISKETENTHSVDDIVGKVTLVPSVRVDEEDDTLVDLNVDLDNNKQHIEWQRINIIREKIAFRRQLVAWVKEVRKVFIIEDPRENDVIFLPGIANHSGTLYYRTIVDQKKAEYQALGKSIVDSKRKKDIRIDSEATAKPSSSSSPLAKPYTLPLQRSQLKSDSMQNSSVESGSIQDESYSAPIQMPFATTIEEQEQQQQPNQIQLLASQPDNAEKDFSKRVSVDGNIVDCLAAASLTIIENPKENDVFFIPSIVNHPGTNYYRALTKQKNAEYQSKVSYKRKKGIRNDLIKQIKDRGGRFLEKCSEGKGFVEIDDVRLDAKVATRFRNQRSSDGIILVEMDDVGVDAKVATTTTGKKPMANKKRTAAERTEDKGKANALNIVAGPTLVSNMKSNQQHPNKLAQIQKPAETDLKETDDKEPQSKSNDTQIVAIGESSGREISSKRTGDKTRDGSTNEERATKKRKTAGIHSTTAPALEQTTLSTANTLPTEQLDPMQAFVDRVQYAFTKCPHISFGVFEALKQAESDASVLMLIQGHDELVLEFISFLRDDDETELKASTTDMYQTRSALAIVQAKKNQNHQDIVMIQCISKMLASQIIERVAGHGRLNLSYILRCLHRDNSKLSGLIPSTNALRAVAVALSTGEHDVSQRSPARNISRDCIREHLGLWKEAFVYNQMLDSDVDKIANEPKAASNNINVGLVSKDITRYPSAAKRDINRIHEFVSAVKRTFSKHPEVYNVYIDIINRINTTQGVDRVGLARHVISLLRQHDHLVLGYLSFLPDNDDQRIESSKTKSITARYTAIMAQKMDSKDVKRIAHALASKIRSILETSCTGQLNLEFILDSLHANDAFFATLFPTTLALRALLVACYQIVGEGDTTLEATQLEFGAEVAVERQAWWYVWLHFKANDATKIVQRLACEEARDLTSN